MRKVRRGNVAAKTIQGYFHTITYTRLFPHHYLNGPGVTPSLRSHTSVFRGDSAIGPSVTPSQNGAPALLFSSTCFLYTGPQNINLFYSRCVRKSPQEHHAASASQVYSNMCMGGLCRLMRIDINGREHEVFGIGSNHRIFC